MDVIQAELYAEEICQNRAFIREAVETEKLKRLQARHKFATSFAPPPGYDANAAATEAALRPLAVVRFKTDRGRVGEVQEPEAWLRVIDKTFRRFKAIYGAGHFETVHQRYNLHMTWKEICAGRVASHRITCQDRRKEFLRLLTLFAVQAGLVVVE